MKHVIMGTAGHIDHGKTQLVKALTGIDTDRLREEKERGITIDLGFAYLNLPSGITVGIVDVPGHERFVKNMVAGATGIDMVLLVVAADEGVMPQTREHMAICRFLGVKRGLVALTKTDLVDPDWKDMVRSEVEQFLQGSFLEDSPIVFTSAVTREGLEELKTEIEKLCHQVPGKQEGASFRMPIDRAFVIKGFGTVVTGTVYSGRVKVGDTLDILPKNRSARVRGLQIHGASVDEIGPSSRAAINLAGLEKEEVERGEVLASPEKFAPSTFMDLSLRLLPETKPLKNWSRVRFHWGTAETMGRIKLLDREVLKPGEEALVRIHLEDKAVTAPGDSFVIRAFSPILTIGGGQVLDSNPSSQPLRRRELHKRLSSLTGLPDAERLTQFLTWAGEEGLSPKEAVLKTSRSVPLTKLIRDPITQGEVLEMGGRYFHKNVVKKLKQRIQEELKRHFEENPLRTYVSREELAHKVWKGNDRIFGTLLEELANSKHLILSPEGVSPITATVTLSAQEESWLTFIKEQFEKAGYSPPSQEEVFKEGAIPLEKGRDLVKLLLDLGELVKISRDIFIASSALERIRKRIANFFSQKETLTIGEFKDLFGVSRKYAVPLLEYLDSLGVTRRVGNIRKAKKI